MHRVDHAIHVLLTAGMSTPALRDIARAVDIEHVAGWWLHIFFWPLVPWDGIVFFLEFIDANSNRDSTGFRGPG